MIFEGSFFVDGKTWQYKVECCRIDSGDAKKRYLDIDGAPARRYYDLKIKPGSDFTIDEDDDGINYYFNDEVLALEFDTKEGKNGI